MGDGTWTEQAREVVRDFVRTLGPAGVAAVDQTAAAHMAVIEALVGEDPSMSDVVAATAFVVARVVMTDKLPESMPRDRWAFLTLAALLSHVGWDPEVEV